MTKKIGLGTIIFVTNTFSPLYFFVIDFYPLSFSLGSDDTHFEVGMASNGCEVHRFDPSVKSAHVLESEHFWYHRLSIDWRDPHPAVAAQKPYSNTRKLGTILNEFGHHKVRFFHLIS